jgi:glycerol-3-phosphate dehydrogenase
MKNFSVFERKNSLQRLSSTQYDLVVIGGGITGAGIALDASSRGMTVALVEKNDFASGTSSKSTKLIHGGLRYLKQFDFWLVKEVGTERAIVHKLAPHLVVPEKMLLPLIEGGTYGSWLTSIGLKVYDILAAVEGDDQRKMLDKKEALQKEPLLPKKILNGAGYYAEYRTDDSRLTIEVLKTAAQQGAEIINYVSVSDFLYEDNTVSGVLAKDELTNETFEIKSKFVVNAAGPWVDELREINQSKKGKELFLTKGVHLVVDHKIFPVQQSVYFDVPDGRMMFAIPRGKVTYFGTTDTPFADDKNNVTTSKKDAEYLIDAVNHMFPDIHINMEDIRSSWAGLRPLIFEEGKSASELSRKDELFISDNRLISIAGGKLTGYRKMAERVVNLVAKKAKKHFDLNFDEIQTQHLKLCGGDFKNYEEVRSYTDAIFIRINEVDFDQKYAEYLVHTYGKQTDVILQKFDELQEDDQEVKMIKAEVWFAIHFEMAYSPIDFFMRRTGRLFFDMESVTHLKKLVLNEFCSAFHWTDQEVSREEKALEKAIVLATSFKN